MTSPGDDYECDACGGVHTVKADDDADGVPAALGRRQFSVECPEAGTIRWDE